MQSYIEKTKLQSRQNKLGNIVVSEYDTALKYIAEELGQCFSDDGYKAVLWMMTPNPLLGNIVPAWLMLAHPDGPKKLKEFVKNCREGNLP